MQPNQPVSGNTYVNQYTNYELDEDQLKTLLTRRDTQLSTSLNFKTNGVFETVELQNGEQFFTTNNVIPKRFVFRQVFVIPTSFLPLAAGNSITVPISISGVTMFTKIYGTATTATDSRPIPNSDIKIVVNTTGQTVTGYTITNEATSATITSGIVILEYVKQ